MDGKPLLIECKAGQHYQQGIEKFNRHRERLQLDSDQAIFVVLDIDESEAYLRNKNWNFTVADQNNFLDRIQSTLAVRADLHSIDDNDDPEAELTIPAAADDDILESFFKKQRLNLAPEHRSSILDQLIRLMDAQAVPSSFNEISRTLRDQMKAELGLSREKISEVLNCLRHFGFFRDSQNRPVRNTGEPIYRMESLKPKTLERKCMEFYVERILQRFDPDFFDDENNVLSFESLTYGKAPSAEKISQMKERWGDTQADAANED
ncbi:hypothetical protein IQ241_08445 [Romeria aff. gracilis LEGE 07310]|uniref:Uncharacterized protein n=1 Tax=Vasconcelosia minhoensis LEGE 07310 TaxID=915328 RepID=A0A8J7AGV8_9CYAN|nr:hypothetical protein [Romeria gracilis]MBE9077323.1 hypothetical protein [Romeria aff. gracilis LEGE 07310]